MQYLYQGIFIAFRSRKERRRQTPVRIAGMGMFSMPEVAVHFLFGILDDLWYKILFQREHRCLKYAKYAVKGPSSGKPSVTHTKLPRKNGSPISSE